MNGNVSNCTFNKITLDYVSRPKLVGTVHNFQTTKLSNCSFKTSLMCNEQLPDEIESESRHDYHSEYICQPRIAPKKYAAPQMNEVSVSALQFTCGNDKFMLDHDGYASWYEGVMGSATFKSFVRSTMNMADGSKLWVNGTVLVIRDGVIMSDETCDVD